MASFSVKKLKTYIEVASRNNGIVCIMNDPVTAAKCTQIHCEFYRESGEQASHYRVISSFFEVCTSNPNYGFVKDGEKWLRSESLDISIAIVESVSKIVFLLYDKHASFSTKSL